MKNLLFCTSIALIMSLSSFGELGTVLTYENINNIQQGSNWEYLGDINAVTYSKKNVTGQLYVRVIGGKEFYQVRVKDYFGQIKACSVSFGSFDCGGKEYNAKFSAEIDGLHTYTYFFNI